MFYLVIVQNDTTQTIFSHASLDSALASYHTELAYRADDRYSTKCAILDSNLSEIRCEVYTKQVDQVVEPEQEG